MLRLLIILRIKKYTWIFYMIVLLNMYVLYLQDLFLYFVKHAGKNYVHTFKYK